LAEGSRCAPIQPNSVANKSVLALQKQPLNHCLAMTKNFVAKNALRKKTTETKALATRGEVDWPRRLSSKARMMLE
jgi:hypothetical protein